MLWGALHNPKSQLHSFAALRCASLCRRKFHTACVDVPENAIKLLTTIPNLIWQCESCVVSNDSHSKTDEIYETPPGSTVVLSLQGGPLRTSNPS